MSDSIFQKNMDAMAKRFPAISSKINEENDNNQICADIVDIEVKKVLICTKDDKTYQLDSAYDSDVILNEWNSFMKTECTYKTYIIFGFGNGMYVKKILEQEKGDFRVIIYEPTINILKVVVKHFDISKIISDNRVELYVKGCKKSPFTDELYGLINYSTLPGLLKNDYLNYSKLFPEEKKKFSEDIDTVYNSIKASRYVNERFGEDYYNNSIENFKYFIKGKSLADLARKMPENVPAFIVSSGPSLNKNINDLKAAKGKSIIIATDSALLALLNNGIIPDLYVCVDPHKEKEHFTDERIKNIPAVVLVTSSKYALFDDQKQFFTVDSNSKNIVNIMAGTNKKIQTIDLGGSVANDCLGLAIFLGCNTIVFVGQDLAYTNNKTHASNTAREGLSVEDSTTSLTTIKDIYGNDVKSSGEFLLYKSVFERTIVQYSNRNYIDATEGGAYIEGTKVATLKETVEEYCTENIDIPNIIDNSEDFFNDEEKVIIQNNITSIPKEISLIMSDCRKCIGLYDEMYMCAKLGNLNKSKIEDLLSKTSILSDKIDRNPVMYYISYLNQKSVKNILDNTYKKKNDVRDEIMEAATLGKNHVESILKVAEFEKKDMETRFKEAGLL